jgi:hypothetical protein
MAFYETEFLCLLFMAAAGLGVFIASLITFGMAATVFFCIMLIPPGSQFFFALCSQIQEADDQRTS